MNNLFFNLSKELQDLIYSYDSTYYNIYNDTLKHINYIIKANYDIKLYNYPFCFIEDAKKKYPPISYKFWGD